jgi:hypothetical protein
MVFTKENFAENRCMSFVMVKKKRQNPALFVSEAGHLTSRLSNLMKNHEINFGLDKDKYEYNDLGYMLVRFGRITVFNNVKYNRLARAATLNFLGEMGNGVQVVSQDILKKNDELIKLDKKYKNRGDDKYDAFSLRRLNKVILFDYQDGYCWDCGKKYNKLELHHKIPRSLYGSDNIANLVLLCGEQSGDDACDCHKNWDDLALGEGHIVFPGFSMDILPSICFRDRIKEKKKKIKPEPGNTRNRKYRHVGSSLAFNNRISCRPNVKR